MVELVLNPGSLASQSMTLMTKVQYKFAELWKIVYQNLITNAPLKEEKMANLKSHSCKETFCLRKGLSSNSLSENMSIQQFGCKFPVLTLAAFSITAIYSPVS